MINLLTLVTAAVVALGSNLNAAGFRLSEQDAKANGMGNSFTAVADNASAAWYNPAAMTELERTNLSLGSVLVYPVMEHKNTAANGGAVDAITRTLHIPPAFYATHKYGGKWAFGFGFNAPFGLSTEWDKAAKTATVATLSDIKVLNSNLNAAYKVNDKLSFGLGVDYVTLDATLNKMLNATLEQKLSGAGTGWGYNAAAFYKRGSRWTFGASYRGPVRVKVEGTNEIPGGGRYTDANTVIRLPDTFQLGAAYRSNDKWLFSATADYTDWATYHKLIIKWNNDASVSNDIKNWKSVWALRAGAEYKYSDTWKFRGGAFYDKNPVPKKRFETRVPDSDRAAVSVGAGYGKGRLIIDLSYTCLTFLERKTADSVAGTVSTVNTKLDGEYAAIAHLPAVSVGYKF